MKRKLLSLILALGMILSFAVIPASANGEDLVFTQDTLLRRTGYFVMYNSITVKSGATLTIDKDYGFEIARSVTVEPGARLICNGVGDVQFQFSMRYDGATIAGVDLYYPQKWDDGSVTYEQIPTPFVSDWSKGIFSEDQRPAFKWNPACGEGGGWCLTWSLGGNPFNVKFYHLEREMDTARDAAMELNRLGLFRGVGTNADGSINFDLARKATRAEGLVMLLRLLGKEEEALSGTWSHPFSDGGWADKYIGYAYENGLTKGKGDGTFGSTDTITAQQYMTFLLRALEYDDSDNKLYANALTLSEQLGLMTSEDSTYEICVKDFWRADMVVASLRCLHARTASGESLADKLGVQF